MPLNRKILVLITFLTCLSFIWTSFTETPIDEDIHIIVDSMLKECIKDTNYNKIVYIDLNTFTSISPSEFPNPTKKELQFLDSLVSQWNQSFDSYINKLRICKPTSSSYKTVELKEFEHGFECRIDISTSCDVDSLKNQVVLFGHNSKLYFGKVFERK